ncbi:MAG: stage II sporulation protein R [Bacillota bacterium]
MKKNLFIFICIILSLLYIFSFYIFSPIENPYENSTQISSDEFLRLHIRANSNSQSDQQIKYAVRDEVLLQITNATACAGTTQEAIAEVLKIADQISQTASQISGQTATIEITTETFPTREYNGEILPAGEYQSIIINLGSSQGDNWWCVAFPPLCYIDGEEIEGDEIVFQSKIVEILDKYL